MSCNVKRQLIISLALLFLHCSAPRESGFPTAVIPPAPRASDWPDVGAAILDDVALLEYRFAETQEGEELRLIAVLNHRRRIKILSEKGLEQATVDLPVDGFGTVTRVEAQAVSPDGDVERFDSGDLEVRPWPGLERAPGLKVLRARIPGAVVGGLIDYRYERVFVDVDFVPPWVYAQSLPVVRSELSLVADAGIKLDLRSGVGEKPVERQPLRRAMDDGRERLVFVEQNLEPVYPEPDMPHPTRVAPWTASVVVSADLGTRRRRFASWEHARHKVEAMLARVGGAEVAGTAEQRYAKVRDAVRGVQALGLGVLPTMQAGALMNGEPTSSRDAAALLTAVLRDGGAKAYPALLTAAGGPPAFDGFPALYPFVRAVVAVDVRDQIARDPSCREDPVSRGLLCTVPPESYAFVDPLCRHCRFGELPTELTGGRALVFLPDRARWVDVPSDPPERNRTLTQYRYVLGLDGSLRGHMSGELSGAPSRRVRSRVAESELEALLGETLFGPESPVRLSELELMHRDEAEKPLRVRGKAESKAVKLDYEQFRLRPVDFVGSVLPGRWRGLRRYDALLEAPAWVETVATIEVPVGYRVETGETVRIIEPFAEYAAGFALRERSLTFSRRLVVKAQRLDPEQYERFREFLDKVAAAEERGVGAGLNQ